MRGFLFDGGEGVNTIRPLESSRKEIRSDLSPIPGVSGTGYLANNDC